MLLSSNASRNLVLGNFLGVNLFSNAAANRNGIELGGTQNTIGGSVSGAFNFLSGNKNDGVLTGTQDFTFAVTTTVTGTDPLITATLTDGSGDTSLLSSGVTMS